MNPTSYAARRQPASRWQQAVRAILPALFAHALLASQVLAFALLPDFSTGNVETDLGMATRWSAEADPVGFGTGLHDGLQVAVAFDFAERLGAVSAEDQATIADVIRRAFAAWETPDMRFDIDFTRLAVQGVEVFADHGFEIDVFAVPQTHPVFAGQGLLFGYAYVSWQQHEARLLTNATRSAGLVNVAADVYINFDSVTALGSFMSRERRTQALQRLLMHEIGHTLGFGHPIMESLTNYDNDADPLNVLRVDPLAPYAGLLHSPNRTFQAIMSNDRRNGPYIYFNQLQNDDRGGRDVLYPSLISCAADCDGNGRFAIADIASAVSVALGTRHIDTCWRADRDSDGSVQIDELVQALDPALRECATVLSPAESPPLREQAAFSLGGVTSVGCELP